MGKYLATTRIDNIDGDVVEEGATIELDGKAEKAHAAAITAKSLVLSTSPEARAYRVKNASVDAGSGEEDQRGAHKAPAGNGTGAGDTTVALADMTKADLVAHAEKHKITVDPKATKAEMIDAIEKGTKSGEGAGAGQQ
jgi:hypothetical protein